MKILQGLSEFLSGKYGCDSIFVFIGTVVSIVIWLSGATAITSYILPVVITLIGELIKFSAFREVKKLLQNKMEPRDIHTPPKKCARIPIMDLDIPPTDLESLIRWVPEKYNS